MGILNYYTNIQQFINRDVSYPCKQQRKSTLHLLYLHLNTIRVTI